MLLFLVFIFFSIHFCCSTHTMKLNYMFQLRNFSIREENTKHNRWDQLATRYWLDFSSAQSNISFVNFFVAVLLTFRNLKDDEVKNKVKNKEDLSNFLLNSRCCVINRLWSIMHFLLSPLWTKKLCFNARIKTKGIDSNLYVSFLSHFTHIRCLQIPIYLIVKSESNELFYWQTRRTFIRTQKH